MLSKILIFVSICFNYSQFIEPPNFIFHNFFQCVANSTAISANVQARWINKTQQVLDGNLTTPIPLGDNLNAKIVAYKLAGSRWLHMTNITCKGCQLLRNYLGPLKKVFLGAIGFTENTCPIPKGSYHSRNVYFDMGKSRVPVFPIGTFKIHLALHNVDNDVLQLCLGIVMEHKSHN